MARSAITDVERSREFQFSVTGSQPHVSKNARRGTFALTRRSTLVESGFVAEALADSPEQYPWKCRLARAFRALRSASATGPAPGVPGFRRACHREQVPRRGSPPPAL